MKNILIILSMVAFFSCNSSKDEKKDKGNSDGTVTKTDTTSTNTSTGKLDIETFGPLKIGQHYQETMKIMGEPVGRMAPIEWEADGLMHEDFNYPSKGLVIGLAFEPGKPETKSIFSITASASNDFKTRANMGIGNTYTEVEAAYKKDIDREMTDKETIVVGSVYGGIIFNFTNDRVTKVFLGAAAE